MKTMFGMLKVALGVAVLATLFAQLAGAQCVSMGTPKRNTSLLRQPFLTNPFTPAAFSSGCLRRGRRYAEPRVGIRS